MTNVFDLYKILPVCCSGMKTQNKLFEKYNMFFTYILFEECEDVNINNYSIEQLYEKYIKFIDSNTISRDLVEKLCDVDKWIEIYQTEDAIIRAFSKLDIGYSGGNNNIWIYTKKLVDMLIKYRVVQLTMLETYAMIHTGNSFYEHLDEISLKPSISEKQIDNGCLDHDGYCDVVITIHYDLCSNSYIRKDRLYWCNDGVEYEKNVPEYCNIDTITETIIPCYYCRMGETIGECYYCSVKKADDV